MSIGRVPGDTGIQPSIVDAKGDLIVATAADSVSRLAVGANDTVLTADSTQATGLKWAAIPAPTFVGCFLTKSTNQSINNATLTAITFDTEELDTDGFHSTVTNTSRITIPSGKAGKYLIIGQVAFGANTTGQRYFKIIKNASGDGHDVEVPTSSVSNKLCITQTSILNLAVGDYIEISAGQHSGGALNVLGDANGPATTRFAVTYLGA